MADNAIEVRGGERTVTGPGNRVGAANFALCLRQPESLESSGREVVVGTYNHAFPVAVGASKKRGAKAEKQEHGNYNKRDDGFEIDETLNTRIMRRVDQQGELDGGVFKIEMRPEPDAREQLEKRTITDDERSRKIRCEDRGWDGEKELQKWPSNQETVSRVFDVIHVNEDPRNVAAEARDADGQECNRQKKTSDATELSENTVRSVFETSSPSGQYLSLCAGPGLRPSLG
ncbi:hypothetical protein B0H13DRAFT_1870407 [Mycena leptocephala]|nr:hypothetical protein B0H13DRAFT_1870407 [Mycena leptocephala]